MTCDYHLPPSVLNVQPSDEVVADGFKMPPGPRQIKGYDVWICGDCGDFLVPDGFGFRGMTVEDYCKSGLAPDLR